MSCPFSIEDIQSWWEVPSIAHFCSLFRVTFNLLDFDIEELEEALLNDGTEECASSLLTELIVRLLQGCLRNSDISAFNYQMFLRRLFRQKCQEKCLHNPFNDDIDFQFLPLRTKVEILYSLCDFRLDSADVFDLFKNLEAESLRVEPLGWDNNWSAYWYFYGTRLYREDFKDSLKGRRPKKHEELKFKRCSEILRTTSDKDRVWQVVCFTEADWLHLAEKFKWSSNGMEKKLYQSLAENFLPEIPRLFQEKLRLQRKRLLESMPRRTSTRVQSLKTKSKEDDISEKQSDDDAKFKSSRDSPSRPRSLRPFTPSSLSGESNFDQSGSAISSRDFRATARALRERGKDDTPDSSKSEKKMMKPTGRRTNNSLASATGQIVIPDIQERVESTRKKVKTSQIFAQSEEDVQTDMYKVLQQLKAHEDAWPFMDPVEEEYAPNYYSVIRRPMDLGKMEERLDRGFYTDLSMFKTDFNLIVNNCRLYNGQDNEYTEMVDKLQIAFNKLTRRYFDCPSSSEEEMVVEYPLQYTPVKKYSKIEKRSSREDVHKTGVTKRKRSSSRESNPEESEAETLGRCSVSSKQSSIKGHTKHSKSVYNNENRAYLSDMSDAPPIKKSKKTRSEKKKKLKSLKKSRKHKYLNKKLKKKRSKHNQQGKKKKSRRISTDSRDMDSSYEDKYTHKSKSELTKKNKDSDALDSDFYKDKYDKIKERRRQASKNSTNTSHKGHGEKSKSRVSHPEKEKNSNLKETIEKLKAKSEKRSDSLFNELFSSNTNSHDKKGHSSSFSQDKNASKNLNDEYEFIDDNEKSKDKKKPLSTKNVISKKITKNDKNESASEALEQAVKDISKWLDDTPKLSEFDSDTNSPLQVPNTDEFTSIIKLDEEISSINFDKEKAGAKKETQKKRTVQKDVPKVVRRKEIQRTIERLQPGKSKGNLISNIQVSSKQEELSTVVTAITVKAKEIKNTLLSQSDESSPKLSLGTVLPTVRFGLGSQHDFNTEQNAAKVAVVDTGTMTCETENNANSKSKTDELTKISSLDNSNSNSNSNSQDTTEKPNKPVSPTIKRQGQEKATPNLSAWFKAFGAPKSGTSSKKKSEDIDQEDSKSNDNHSETKTLSPTDNMKTEQIPSEEPFTPDGGESPIPNHLTSSRPRRTSTGSSVSERSSFSQDLDSPRHQPSHTSPLLRSPASPRTEDHQKPYPLMNVTVRVGFYQDTASVKSSPEKSCSPREAPPSPYSTYPQHVYAGSANNSVSQTPSHSFTESANKSPLLGYSQPSYYDTTKTTSANSKVRSDEFNTYASDSLYQQPVSPFAGQSQSSYSHHSQHSPFSHVQNSSQTFGPPSTVPTLPQTIDTRAQDKSSMFPVKKRTYSESCQAASENVDQLSIKRNNILDQSEKIENLTSVIQDTNAVSGMNNPFSVTSNLGYSHLAKSDDQLRNLALNKHAIDNKVSALSNIGDISSNDYLSRKSPFDFSSSSLSKAYYSDNANALPSTMIPKRTYSEVDSPVNMVNMGYSGKHYDNNKNKSGSVDLINMGYSMPDPVDTKASVKSMDKANMTSSVISKPYKHFDMFSTPVSSRSDLSSLQEYSKSTIDTHKYYDKLNPYYQNLSTDLSRLSSEATSHNLSKVHSSNLMQYQDNLSRHPTPYSFSDWKNTEQSRAGAEVHNLSMSQNKNESRDLALLPSKQVSDTSISEVDDLQKSQQQSELRIPIIRAVIEISSSIKPENQQPTLPDYNSRMRNVNLNMPINTTRSSDSIYGHNLTTSSNDMTTTSALQYKPLHSHSSLASDPSMRNLFPPVMDRLKDERLLSSYQTTDTKSYYDKSLHLAYSKNMHSGLHGNNPTSSMYPVSSMAATYTRDSPYVQPLPMDEPEKKPRSKKKKNESVIQPSPNFHHNYGSMKSSQQITTESSPISLKTSNIVPGSAFNFGPPGSLGTGLFGESSAFLEDLRNSSTSQYMAANYMAAAAAAHQRSTPESGDKCVKPAHQSSTPNPFPFLGHSQVRPGYSSLIGLDPSSAIYQQYLQRHQEELLRHSSSQMMGLFSQGYPGSLSGRQPFDSINRHSWI